MHFRLLLLELIWPLSWKILFFLMRMLIICFQQLVSQDLFSFAWYQEISSMKQFPSFWLDQLFLPLSYDSKQSRPSYSFLSPWSCQWFTFVSQFLFHQLLSGVKSIWLYQQLQLGFQEFSDVLFVGFQAFVHVRSLKHGGSSYEQLLFIWIQFLLICAFIPFLFVS